MSSESPAGDRWRPALSVEALILLASLAFTVSYNGALWQQLFGPGNHLTSGRPALLAALVLIVTCIQFAGLTLLLARRTVKPVLALLFLLSALASYYMDRYTVFLNPEMLRNIFATNPAEAGELLTVSLIPHLLLYAVLPIALLIWIRIPVRPLHRAILIRSGAVAGALLVAGLALFAQFGNATSLLRNHREARHLVTPTNYLASLYKIARDSVASPAGDSRPIALDAHRLGGASATRKPVLLVLAIGETVRSANFGLSGYGRQTTPELSRMNLLVYPRVQACGTSTEVSLPCMFAPVGRRDYQAKRIRSEESLLHVLNRVGFKVLWIDNQSGCKGVCARLAVEGIEGNEDPAFCDGERCLDGILLPRLQAGVKANGGDLVVVLHMLGNHGPAYSRRYPPEFRKFIPTCESLDLSGCSRTEIVNAYDNAILYTDHVLASIIRYLEAQSGRDTGLVYVSDHGESLGESGLYLHGLPYAIAPDYQREVPMLVWLSPGLETSAALNPDCLQQGVAGEVAHDHLFHSVLGLLEVDTVVREPALDLFSRCRSTLPQATRTSPGTGADHPRW